VELDIASLGISRGCSLSRVSEVADSGGIVGVGLDLSMDLKGKKLQIIGQKGKVDKHLLVFAP
jgi:fibrillarin-like rRNA methylase